MLAIAVSNRNVRESPWMMISRRGGDAERCPCCVKAVGSWRRGDRQACWWLDVWLRASSAERAEAREQLWLSRRNRAEPGSCWLFSEYAVCVLCACVCVCVCVCVQGASRGNVALVRNHIFTLQITTKQFSRTTDANIRRFYRADGWMRMMEGWAEECRNEGTKTRRDGFMEGWMSDGNIAVAS